MHDVREEREYPSEQVARTGEVKIAWKLPRTRSDRFSRHGNARCATYLKVELAELLLGVDVGVSRHNYGTGGERHLCVWRLAVIRSDGGQAAVVSELLVQNGRVA